MAGLATHLHYHEPSNYVLVSFLQRGLFHKLCSQPGARVKGNSFNTIYHADSPFWLTNCGKKIVRNIFYFIQSLLAIAVSVSSFLSNQTSKPLPSYDIQIYSIYCVKFSFALFQANFLKTSWGQWFLFWATCLVEDFFTLLLSEDSTCARRQK